MTRIDPVGKTLQSYAAAVAGDDNVLSEQELTENGLPQSIPQTDTDPAINSAELEAYLLGMASAHGSTITINQVDYAVSSAGEIMAACQTSAVDVQAMRGVVELLQIMMSAGASIGEITGYLTSEGIPGQDNSSGAFSFIAASGQLMDELSGREAPNNRPALADLMIRSIAIRMGALTRALRNSILGTSGRSADEPLDREGALQGMLLDAERYPIVENIDNLISALAEKIRAQDAGSNLLPVLKDLYVFAVICKLAAQLEETFVQIVGDDPVRSQKMIDLYRRIIGDLMAANVGSRPELATILSDMINKLVEAISELSPGCQSVLPPIPEILPVDTSDEERVVQLEAAWGEWLIQAKEALSAQVRTTLPPIEQAGQGPTTAEITFTPMFVDDISRITADKIKIVDTTGQQVAGVQVTGVRVDGDRLVLSLTIDEGVALGNYSIRLIGVGSWYSTQVSVQPSTESEIPVQGVDYTVTIEPQDIETVGFSIVTEDEVSPDDLEAVRREAALIRTAEAPVESRWIDAGQGDGLEYSVSAYGGVGSSSGVDLGVVGMADGETITPTVGADASFGASFLVDNYRFRLGLLSRGLYEGGDGEEAPETGMFSLAASVTGADLFSSFYPDFSLGLGYRHLWNDAETPSHPEGDELSVGLDVNEVFPLSSHVGLGITTGMDIAWSVGESRYGWERYEVPVGARLRFSSSDANLDLALGYLYRSQIMRERAGEGFGEHSTNIDGNGFFLDTTVETGDYAGNIGFSALYLDDPETVDVDLRYRYPFSWGSVGGSVGYESEDYLGPVVTRVPISVSAEGEVYPGFELFGQAEGGPLWLDTPEGAVEPDQSGGYFGLTVGARMGSRSTITEELIDDTPSASPARIAEDSSRDINNAIALRYLLAFKMGLLDENYELDEDTLPPNIEAAYTEADARGPYGYGSGAAGGGTLMPPRGERVSLGDVAPVVCYLGINPILEGIDVDNYTPIDPLHRDRFEDQLYVFEGRGDKLRVLNVGTSRHAVIEEEGIAVDAVDEGTTLTGDLLGAVMVMVEDVDRHISRAGVEFFLSLLENWDEIGTNFGGTREEFIEQLLTELRGEVVGKAVMAVAKWVLGVSDLESLDEGQINQVMAKAFALRLSMLREPGETRSRGAEPAEEPAEEPDTLETEELDIVPDPAEEPAEQPAEEERTI